MNPAISIMLIIFAGMVLGCFFRNKRFQDFFIYLSSAAIYSLLFLLGAGLGANESLFHKLHIIGGLAVTVTLASCLGSGLGMAVLQKCFFKQNATAQRSGTQHVHSPIWPTIRIFCCFLLGIVMARAGLLPEIMQNSNFAEYALWVLVFAVGIGLGADIKAFLIVREMPFLLLAVPLFVILGSFLGAALIALCLPGFSVLESITVSSGFGYYSLSSILIEKSGNSFLAAIALVSNIFRELLGILTTPFAARYFGGLIPIGVAGAPSMDTCLPVIARYSGERFAIISVFSGVILTLLVPFLVTFLCSF